MTRGIRAVGAHVPHFRLDRATVAATFGKGGGQGTRTVASFDEDTTTMAVEACRAGQVHGGDVAALWFATPTPAYLDKNNASAVHAALGLDPSALAVDFGGSLRSGMGALLTALRGTGEVVVVASDLRGGLPTSVDESEGGDGAAAVRVGDDGGDTDDGGLIAAFLGAASATDELIDRWRAPGEDRSRAWEERFAEGVYVPLVADAVARACADAGIDLADIDVAVVTGMHQRAAQRAVAKVGLADRLADHLGSTVGNVGAAQPLLVLTSVLESAGPGRTIGLVHLADGVDAVVLRTTDAVSARRPGTTTVAAQIGAGAPVPYGTFLAWRGQVTVEPPNRPGPNRVSAPAAHRRADWKFRFAGSRDRSSGMLHLPPARVSESGGAVDDMETVVMADVSGTIAALTVDRLAYSPSPPVVFAVVDFDGGGRAPLELTDVDAASVAVGDRVVPTFRRLTTADGIHNYFWKARRVI